MTAPLRHLLFLDAEAPRLLVPVPEITAQKVEAVLQTVVVATVIVLTNGELILVRNLHANLGRHRIDGMHRSLLASTAVREIEVLYVRAKEIGKVEGIEIIPGTDTERGTVIVIENETGRGTRIATKTVTGTGSETGTGTGTDIVGTTVMRGRNEMVLIVHLLRLPPLPLWMIAICRVDRKPLDTALRPQTKV
jgi:hypothetical protein